MYSSMLFIAVTSKLSYIFCRMYMWWSLDNMIYLKQQQFSITVLEDKLSKKQLSCFLKNTLP